eukprot:21555-Rhodomonas_salina.2
MMSQCSRPLSLILSLLMMSARLVSLSHPSPLPMMSALLLSLSSSLRMMSAHVLSLSSSLPMTSALVTPIPWGKHSHLETRRQIIHWILGIVGG